MHRNHRALLAQVVTFRAGLRPARRSQLRQIDVPARAVNTAMVGGSQSGSNRIS